MRDRLSATNILGWTLALSFLHALNLYAAPIYYVNIRDGEVSASQELKNMLHVNDEVCIKRIQKSIACGNIIFSDDKFVTATFPSSAAILESYEGSTYIELRFKKEIPRVGDELAKKLKLAPAIVAAEEPPSLSEIRPFENEKNDLVQTQASEGNRSLASHPEVNLPIITEVDALSGKWISVAPELNPMSTVTVGLNYIFPVIQYQQVFTENYGFGLMGSYVKGSFGNGQLEGVGGMVIFHYYSIAPFRGFWVQLGGGAYQMKTAVLGVSNNLFAPTFLGTIGWRWRWYDGITAGFGVGIQKILLTNPPDQNLDFSGAFPAINIDIGFAF